MKKALFEFIKFIKNNIFFIFAAYWLIDFVIGSITFKPSTLDDTARKIKILQLGLDLLWSVVFFIQHGVVKVHEVLSKRIELVEKEVDLIYDTIRKAVEESEKENKEAEIAEEKEEDSKEEKKVD